LKLKSIFTCLLLAICWRNGFSQNKLPNAGVTLSKFPTGFVVTVKGDTIQSEFDGKVFPDLKFRAVNSKEKFQRINIAKINGWYSNIDSTIYRALPIDSLSLITRYFRLWVFGVINVYERYDIDHSANMPGFSTMVASKGILSVWAGSNSFRNATAHASGGFYLSINNGVLKPIPRKGEKIKSLFSMLFEDDSELLEKFKNETDLSIGNVMIYINDYDIFKSGHHQKNQQ
jgi:hypothetical protein